MERSITLVFRREKKPQGIFRVKSYHDLMDLQGSADIDNFQAIKLASVGDNGIAFFNDIAKFQRIDLAYLRYLQFPENSYYGTVKAKMGWLHEDLDESGASKPGRPYWTKNAKSVFGTILFGQTSVMVENNNGIPIEYNFKGQFPGESVTKIIPFYKVVGLPSDMKYAATHEEHPYWIVDATAIEGGKPTNRPRGVTIRHPVWNTKDHPTNFGDGENYIAKAFLEI